MTIRNYILSYSSLCAIVATHIAQVKARGSLLERFTKMTDNQVSTATGKFLTSYLYSLRRQSEVALDPASEMVQFIFALESNDIDKIDELCVELDDLIVELTSAIDNLLEGMDINPFWCIYSIDFDAESEEVVLGVGPDIRLKQYHIATRKLRLLKGQVRVMPKKKYETEEDFQSTDLALQSYFREFFAKIEDADIKERLKTSILETVSKV